MQTPEGENERMKNEKLKMNNEKIEDWGLRIENMLLPRMIRKTKTKLKTLVTRHLAIYGFGYQIIVRVTSG